MLKEIWASAAGSQNEHAGVNPNAPGRPTNKIPYVNFHASGARTHNEHPDWDGFVEWLASLVVPFRDPRPLCHRLRTINVQPITGLPLGPKRSTKN